MSLTSMWLIGSRTTKGTYSASGGGGVLVYSSSPRQYRFSVPTLVAGAMISWSHVCPDHQLRSE